MTTLILSIGTSLIWLASIFIADYFRDSLKFAFMQVIQADLDWMKDIWNCHRIRPNQNNETGIPDDLYFLSEQRGEKNLVACS